MMNETVVATVTLLIAMGIADAVWLVTMTDRFYRPALPGLLRETPAWAPALGFYLLYAVGVMVLIVSPAIEREYGLAQVAATGALLGLVAYGTYDLTNQATLRGWSSRVTIVDMLWGSGLTAGVSSLAVLAARQIA